jgi:hypothetical protein
MLGSHHAVKSGPRTIVTVHQFPGHASLQLVGVQQKKNTSWLRQQSGIEHHQLACKGDATLDLIIHSTLP